MVSGTFRIYQWLWYSWLHLLLVRLFIDILAQVCRNHVLTEWSRCCCCWCHSLCLYTSRNRLFGDDAKPLVTAARLLVVSWLLLLLLDYYYPAPLILVYGQGLLPLALSCVLPTSYLIYPDKDRNCCRSVEVPCLRMNRFCYLHSCLIGLAPNISTVVLSSPLGWSEVWHWWR